MTAQTTTRKSRAARAAEKAAEGQDQPQPQVTPDPPDDHGGPSSDTRAKEDQEAQLDRDEDAPDDEDEDEDQDQPTGTVDQPKAQPKPAGPYATVSSEPVMMPYFRGVAEIRVPGPDGTETIERLVCDCTWAHTTEAIAAKCGRRLASGRGLRVRAE
jgi:hypothetical protein